MRVVSFLLSKEGNNEKFLLPYRDYVSFIVYRYFYMLKIFPEIVNEL